MQLTTCRIFFSNLHASKQINSLNYIYLPLQSSNKMINASIISFSNSDACGDLYVFTSTFLS